MVSMNRIITKSVLEDERSNTIVFFILSIFLIAICFGLHQFVKKTEFVQFYVTLCKESKKIVLEPKEEIGLVSIHSVLLEQKHKFWSNSTLHMLDGSKRTERGIHTLITGRAAQFFKRSHIRIIGRALFFAQLCESGLRTSVFGPWTVIQSGGHGLANGRSFEAEGTLAGI